jgi:hypothetical protein
VAKIGWLLCEEALENIGGKFPINPYLFIDDGGGGGGRGGPG